MTTMIAFHGDKAVKAKYLARVAAHRNADELIRGTGWAGGRGCAVGCTLEVYDHSRYPIELGIPEELATIEDKLFEGMPADRAMLWPSEFLRAIPVGSDLSGVWPAFAIWLLTDVRKYAHPDGKAAIDTVVELYRERVPRVDARWGEARSAAVASAAAAAGDTYYAAYASASAAADAAGAASDSASAAANAAHAAHAAYAAIVNTAARACSLEESSYRQSRRLLKLLSSAKAPRRAA